MDVAMIPTESIVEIKEQIVRTIKLLELIGEQFGISNNDIANLMAQKINLRNSLANLASSFPEMQKSLQREGIIPSSNGRKK